MTPPPRWVLVDIEGTTTPTAFVHRVLFPYARAALPDLVATAGADPEVAAALDAVRAAEPDRPPLEVLLRWMDRDAKATPLKTLQGIAWRQGYASGALRGELFADTAAALRGWAAAGFGLAVYSSGSVEAQRLLFRWSEAGDLSDLIRAHFDTAVGAKRDAASYRSIAGTLGVTGGSVLFLSDTEAELDAAGLAGCQTCQIVRPSEGTVASDRHRVAPDLLGVSPLPVSPHLSPPGGSPPRGLLAGDGAT